MMLMMFIITENVKKWTKTVADDEKAVESLKKEEHKQMKVAREGIKCLCLGSMSKCPASLG